jgi:hypothetical protein
MDGGDPGFGRCGSEAGIRFVFSTLFMGRSIQGQARTKHKQTMRMSYAFSYWVGQWMFLLRGREGRGPGCRNRPLREVLRCGGVDV